MNNFVFFPATKYVFGRGVENKAADELKAFGMKKPLIVYGKGSVVRSGLLDRVKKSLEDAGIPYAELGGVQPNPVDSKVYEGIELAKREGIDSVLAVGGGSAIDTAKAIAAAMPY
ncbi:MAG: iron-containing alcohol dehydrogenase, partial [Muribaculaceae bacterium]|nr:iron-containing alcohol dehydrogenase [Muribaculaceae bacterium]